MLVSKFKAGESASDNLAFLHRQYMEMVKNGTIKKSLSRAKLGDVVTMELKVEKPIRNLAQNAKFHKLVKILAEESGYTFDEAKFYLKSQAVSRGYPQEMKNNQPVFFLGQPKGKPSHLASVREMSILIESSVDVMVQNFGFEPSSLEGDFER